MTETVERTETGAILYDKAVINQITPQHFTPQGWPHSEPVSGSLRSAGRGNTMYVGNVPRQFVLRHYMRGGLVGRLRQAGAWKQETLNRLHRSLQKIRSLNPRLHYGEPDWEAFLQGYFSASRSA